MKQKTKDKINHMARLIHAEKVGVKAPQIPQIDYSLAPKGGIYDGYFNAALVSYVEYFPKHRDLLRFKT